MGEENKRPSKDEYYLSIAEQISKRGTCLRRHVGAVIVKDDAIISTGYVGAPRGTPNCIDLGYCFRKEAGIPSGQMYERCRSKHAEENTIINAARTGNKILGGIMYIFDEKNLEAYGPNAKQTDQYGPCLICKKSLINAGIEKIIIKSGERRATFTLEKLMKQLAEEEKQILDQKTCSK